MLLVVQFDPKNVVRQEKGTLVVRVPRHVAKNPGAFLFTLPGADEAAYVKGMNSDEKARTCANVLIGQRGGITLEKYR